MISSRKRITRKLALAREGLVCDVDAVSRLGAVALVNGNGCAVNHVRFTVARTAKSVEHDRTRTVG